MKKLQLYILMCLSSVLGAQSISQGTFGKSDDLSAFGREIFVYDGLPLALHRFKADFESDTRVWDAEVYVRTKFRGGNQYGSAENGGVPFEITLSYTLSAMRGNTAVDSRDVEMTINNDEPEAHFYKSLNEYITANTKLSKTGLTIDSYRISNVEVTPVTGPTGDGSPIDNLQVKFGYNVKYGVHVESTEGNATEVSLKSASTLSDNGKVYKFEWESPVDYPTYEIQVLRLHNQDPDDINEYTLTSKIDWSKASSILLESRQKHSLLTIGEGEGFYAWRVRPIGSFYEGGYGNSQNWGEWSAVSPGQGATVVLQKLGITAEKEFFFFEDPMSGYNYSYSRELKEEGNHKEVITYASQTLQPRQTQVYIPSDDRTILSQSILDYSGRPLMQTLPVPKEGRPDGYENEMVKTEDGTIYTAKNFDTDENYMNPEPINSDENSLFSYYSDNNFEDRRVADAEGYPYSRTVMVADGSSKVRETSGVGKKHMIGSEEDGKGKTVKTYYGTPSESELIALFGDEAPNEKSVSKIILEDQNGTSTVTYRSKEGQVLATGLVFSDKESALLEPNAEPSVNNINDVITENTKKQDGFISTKRLAFVQSTSVDFQYEINCLTLSNLCSDVQVNCGYEVRLRVYDVNDPENIFINSTRNLNDIDCIGGNKTVNFGSETLAPGHYVVEKILTRNPDEASITTSYAKTDAQIVPLTDWVIETLEQVQCEEELVLFYNDLRHLAQRLNSNAPLTGGEVRFDCDGCSNEANASAFYHHFPSDFVDAYHESEVDFSIALLSGDAVAYDLSQEIRIGKTYPVLAHIKTRCCDITVNIQFKPAFKCPSPSELIATSATGKSVNYDYLNTESGSEHYLVDFEGYAVSMMAECIKNFGPEDFEDAADFNALDRDGNDELGIADAKEIIYERMGGWHKEGVFNQMVYHMLTDEYSVAGTGENKELCDRTDEDIPSTEGPGYGRDCNTGSQEKIDGAQYRCSEIAKCWEVLTLNTLKDVCPAYDQIEVDVSMEGSIAENADDQADDEGSYSKNLNDGINSTGLNRRKKRKVKRRIKDKEDASPSIKDKESYTHLVYQFLNCTGFAFADIINPEDPQYPRNSPETRGDYTGDDRYTAGPEYCFVSLDGDFAIGSPKYDPDEYASTVFSDEGFENKEDWQNSNAVGERSIKEIFGPITHPVYAFKYFEYAPGGSSTKLSIETTSCYKDPNAYWDEARGEFVPYVAYDSEDKPVPVNYCGIGYINCEYLKENWNGEQRYTFYLMTLGLDEDEGEDAGNYDYFTCEYYREASDLYYIDEYDLSGLEYLTSQAWNDMYGYHGPEFGTVNVSIEIDGETVTAFKRPKEFGDLRNLLGDKVEVSSISHKIGDYNYMDLEAFRMRDYCTSRCEDRRDEFRDSVVAMFVDRCYVIGGCKISENDNVVPEAVVEKLVDQLVAQCGSQCTVSTYQCVDEVCRELDNPLDEVIRTHVEFGVGGRPGAASDCQASSGARPTECLEGHHVLSYSEYTKYNQAISWMFELDLPSRCNYEGDYNPSISDGKVYVWRGDVLVEQIPVGDCDSPDTYLKRSDYERDSDELLSEGDEEFNETVRSPKIGIEVRHIEEE